ncbi:8-oxo-dGTP pyrophosphatase MutT (NUDIX family) [Hamadaea flava]|uniref:NUDIX domain-containing protein n=1 Tax=Hamadaea flava TaxID=1742688 RepID=A0ABV8LTL7_9ACTN|nr:NUDIX hydrolase [Hamadaea flava]MCP2321799.1 8-oxo-dGTP pyrophosphatase MutT (NUDIX family) [Hamadaea flava]
MGEHELRDEVLAAAAAWVWTPYDATVATSDDVTVVVHEGKGTVQRADGADPARLVTQALRLTGANGGEAVVFVVHPLTTPAHLGDELTRRGSEIVGEHDICAYDLSEGLPELAAPADVTIERVDTPEQLAEAYAVAAEAFGQPLPSPEFAAGEAAELAQQIAAGAGRTIFRYLARIDGRAVGSAGLTMDDGVAKLWGGGVLADTRGRGAYRALLAVRLAQAATLAARFALTRARIGTSSPILRRAGFVAYGREVQHQLPVRRASAEHYRSLPHKILGSGAVFFDESGRVLIVEPSYKDHWEIPGGVVERNEPPLAGAHREVLEELSLDRSLGRLLVVDWSPPRGRRTVDLMAFVFDGGVLTEADVAAIRLQPEELRGYRFCRIDDEVNETAGLLPPILTKRVAAAVRARAAGVTVYLESGDPIDGTVTPSQG